tara:strand:- start:208 stop:666 length:459 start_codon:yes stop_codon:yes gene_type:complete
MELHIVRFLAQNFTNERSGARFIAEGVLDIGWVRLRRRIRELIFGEEYRERSEDWLFQCWLAPCARCQETHELMLWYKRRDAKTGSERRQGRSIRYANWCKPDQCCTTFVVVNVEDGKVNVLGHPDDITDAPPPLVSRQKSERLPVMYMARY